jgi:hypothetical protein
MQWIWALPSSGNVQFRADSFHNPARFMCSITFCFWQAWLSNLNGCIDLPCIIRVRCAIFGRVKLQADSEGMKKKKSCCTHFVRSYISPSRWCDRTDRQRNLNGWSSRSSPSFYASARLSGNLKIGFRLALLRLTAKLVNGLVFE